MSVLNGLHFTGTHARLVFVAVVKNRVLLFETIVTFRNVLRPFDL